MKEIRGYTPGPWQTGELNPRTIFDKDEENAICTAVEQVLDTPLAKTGQPIRAANARLISAAPELVDALIGQIKARKADAYLSMYGNQIDRLEAEAMAEKSWKKSMDADAFEALTKAGVLQFGSKSSCKCDECPDEHTCPRKQDVNNDNETMCTCCEDCTEECAGDV